MKRKDLPAVTDRIIECEESKRERGAPVTPKAVPPQRAAIHTRWLSPTNSRPARVVADSGTRRRTYAYDHGASLDRNHVAAAQALAYELAWDYSVRVDGKPQESHWANPMVCSIMPDQSRCHVFIDKSSGLWAATGCEPLQLFRKHND